MNYAGSMKMACSSHKSSTKILVINHKQQKKLFVFAQSLYVALDGSALLAISTAAVFATTYDQSTVAV